MRLIRDFVAEHFDGIVLLIAVGAVAAWLLNASMREPPAPEPRPIGIALEVVGNDGVLYAVASNGELRWLRDGVGGAVAIEGLPIERTPAAGGLVVYTDQRAVWHVRYGRAHRLLADTRLVSILPEGSDAAYLQTIAPGAAQMELYHLRDGRLSRVRSP